MSETITTTIATQSTAGLIARGTEVRCQLVVIEGPDMGRAVPLREESPVVVGQASSCDLVLSDDRASREHLEVRVDDGYYLVRDLESRNGTWYLGAQITHTRVRAGATFKVGKSFVRIQPRPMTLDIPPSQHRRFGALVAESLAMREVFAVLELASTSDITVLIEGETGTGKELAARAIHDASERCSGPFVAIDCGALPENLIESELFGHLKGAFTGASQRREGAFVRAHRGTLFLDELSGIPLPLQSRLVRVLEERSVRAVGSDRDRPVDVRILGASQTDLSVDMTEGRFRPDLYYRISVLRVVLPPLRMRREDIAPIVRELLHQRGMSVADLEGASLGQLMAYDWPGNVRELRNVVERAIALSPRAASLDDMRIMIPGLAGFDEEALTVRADLPFSEAKQRVIESFERRYLLDLITRHEGNISAAARDAELDRKHLRTLLKKHGLHEG